MQTFKNWRKFRFPKHFFIFFLFFCDLFCSCKTISLGEHQGANAEKILSEAINNGGWIVFENCHVATDWMIKLESLYTHLIKSNEINEDFRIWFVLEPTTVFPLIILRDAIKIVIERPSNFRANMIESYSTEPLNTDKFFNNAFQPPLASLWYRFVFAFNAFHTVARKRILFKPIGWSQPYDFSDSIRKLLLFQARIWFKQYGSIPYENFFYLCNDCNYGNEIVDISDRRLLSCLLKQFCNENAITNENYRFFDAATVCIPCNANRENSIEYLKSLPLKMSPCELGLHDNVAYSRNVNDGKNVSFVLNVEFNGFSFHFEHSTVYTYLNLMFLAFTNCLHNTNRPFFIVE